MEEKETEPKKERESDTTNRKVYRVRFYSPDDLALYMQSERLEGVLSSPGFRNALTIEDAIELNECWLSINCGFRHHEWDDVKYSALVEASKVARGTACRVIREVEPESLLNAVRDLDFDYILPFWRLTEASGVYKTLDARAVLNGQGAQREHVRSVMTSRILVRAYGPIVKSWLMGNPRDGVALALSAGGSAPRPDRKLFLPDEFGSTDLDQMVSDFLADPKANRNYLSALSNDRAFKGTGLALSPRIRAKAEIAERERLDELFGEGNVASFQYGVCVQLSPDQLACHKCSFDGHTATFTFGRKWLEEHLDNATIMNNLAFVFEFMDTRGNLITTSWRHKDRSLLSYVGVHLADEYPVDVSANIDDMRQMGYLNMYNTLLRQNGTSIESAIGWFYNEYIPAEFGIEGFRIDLPGEDYSPMDKCSLISIQVERVLKSFSMFARDGSIIKEQFKHEVFGGFHGIPSIVEGAKYAYGTGPDFNCGINVLFEQRHMLAEVSSTMSEPQSLFELMTQAPLTSDSLDETALGQMRWLIDAGLAIQRDDGAYVVTSRTLVFKMLWEEGFIHMPRLDKRDRKTVDELFELEYLEYGSSLFSKYEADYLSFVFDNRRFSNALALRNRYDHSPDIDDNPRSNKHAKNYLRLLAVLIDVTLKINDELVLRFGSGSGVEFVDWPLDDTDPNDLL